VSGSSLAEQFATRWLAADVLLRPTFPQEEFDRFKTRTRTGLVQQRTTPGFLANELFSRVMYGSHPAGRVALTADALDRTTRDALVAFHTARYVHDHAVLAISGDISSRGPRSSTRSSAVGPGPPRPRPRRRTRRRQRLARCI
jgi:predicted Zn-dependent peptidase